MASYTTTPYMTLALPIAGLATGTGYAQAIDAAFTTIDSHTHIEGQGLPIPTAGLDINADLSFNTFNALQLRSTQYVNQNAPLSLSTDLNCVYVNQGNLYYNDYLGNQVRLTLGGAVDTSGSGNITGMGATTASVVYTSIDKTFSFYSNTNTPAFVLTGPLSIGLNTVSPFTVTLQPSVSQASDYDVTFAPALPSVQSFVTMSNIGQLGNVAPDNITTAIVAGLLTALFPIGMIIKMAGSTIPTGWLLCDGSSLLRASYPALFNEISTAFGAADGAHFNLPDGRGMFFRGVSGASGNDPNAAARIAYTTGGTSGNNLGSYQTSTFSSHTHTQDPHNHTVRSSPGSGAANERTTIVDTVDGNWQDFGIVTPTTATNQSTGGSETRPINLYVNFLIKY